MHSGEKNKDPEVFLSVIICTYNRERHLGRALQSLAEQDFDPARYEIIVVDNNSTDGTLTLAQKFKENHPGLQVIITQEKQKGLTFARNKGIDTARGTYIAFIDDDAVAPRDYARQIEQCAKEYGDKFQACGGKVLPRYETGNPPEWMSKYIQRVISITDWGNKPKTLTHSYPVGCNMFFHKDFFRMAGKFSTDVYMRSEDKYIFFKARKEGIPILYCPAVQVEHFIEKERFSLDYVRKVSYINGMSDRMMIKALYEKPLIPLLRKAADLIYKYTASVVLWIAFSIKGQPVKGRAL